MMKLLKALKKLDTKISAALDDGKPFCVSDSDRHRSKTLPLLHKLGFIEYTYGPLSIPRTSWSKNIVTQITYEGMEALDLYDKSQKRKAAERLARTATGSTTTAKPTQVKPVQAVKTPRSLDLQLITHNEWQNMLGVVVYAFGRALAYSRDEARDIDGHHTDFTLSEYTSYLCAIEDLVITALMLASGVESKDLTRAITYLRDRMSSELLEEGMQRTVTKATWDFTK